MFGGVAQLGERLICIQEVVGSIPISSTKFIGYCIVILYCEYVEWENVN